MSRAAFAVLPVALLAADLASTMKPGAREGELTRVAFMAGCWEGSFRDQAGLGVIEEHYTKPTTNTMLGTTRYIRDGRTIQFEFTLIEGDSAAIRLIPYPNGRRSEHAFVLTRSALDQAVFEAPEHDFPKRIIYRQDGTVGLRARIDAGTGETEAREWYMQKADCF